MGEEHFPEGYRVATRAEQDAEYRDVTDIGDAVQLLGRRLAGATARAALPVHVITDARAAQSKPRLRERLERERAETITAIEALTAQLARRTAQLAELDRYPADDPFQDGEALKFTKRFPDGHEYTYMALRSDGRWFVTGARGPQDVKWEKFVEWLGLGVTDVVKIGNTRNTPVKW